MRWRMIAMATLLMAGCSDKFSQGDDVILVDARVGEVAVTGMPEHVSQSEPLRLYHESTKTPCTEELIVAGTKARVVQDDHARSDADRDVKINLIDPPYAGLTGVVKRKYLRRE